MAERSSGRRTLVVFVAVTVLVAAAVVFLARSGRGPVGERAAAPAPSVDSVQYYDSVMYAIERSRVRGTMTLSEVAVRAEIPVGDLVAELRLPSSVSTTAILNAVLPPHGRTIQDVVTAVQRVRARVVPPPGPPR